jgi:hypothetical protein
MASDGKFIDTQCSENCERAPECAVCGLRKKPIGRSAPLEMANSLCDDDCSGYRLEPTPGHLWPGEYRALAPGPPFATGVGR